MASNTYFQVKVSKSDKIKLIVILYVSQYTTFLRISLENSVN